VSEKGVRIYTSNKFFEKLPNSSQLSHRHSLTYKWNYINGNTFVYCFAIQLYFLFEKSNYGIKVDNCNLTVRHIDYFQRSSPLYAMQAFGDVHPKPGAYYTRELLFPHQQQW